MRKRNPVKVYVDDLRNPPDDSWTVARTNTDAIQLLATGYVEAISIDHDICVPNIEFVGEAVKRRLKIGEETYKPVVYYLTLMRKELLPKEIYIHTANPNGGKTMLALLNDAGVVAQFKQGSYQIDIPWDEL